MIEIRDKVKAKLAKVGTQNFTLKFDPFPYYYVIEFFKSDKLSVKHLIFAFPRKKVKF